MGCIDINISEDKCNKITFSTPAKLKRHQYSLTPCTENFKCEYCTKTAA